MPIFWRYMWGQYLKVLLLAVFSFIAILLVSRLEEIAQFAALGASFRYLGLFTLYQIPYILPIAIPISCLISALILFQRLSHTQELTALRASGLSLRHILAPIVIAGFLFTLGNFYITSELATTSHMTARKMTYEITSGNPLLLLQNAKVAKLKGAYVQMDPIRTGEAAEDLIIAMKRGSSERLNLLLAEKLLLENGMLVGSHVTLLTTLPSKTSEEFDHLMIENQKKAKSPAPEFAKLLRNQGWKISADHLNFSLLRARIHALQEGYKANPLEAKNYEKLINKCYSDTVRRFCLGLAPLSFTLLGAAFGMDISRNPRKRGIIIVLFLGAFSLVAFFTAKELGHQVPLATTLFLLPHFLILAASVWTLRRIKRGIE